MEAGEEALPRPPPGGKGLSLRSLAPLALAPGGLDRAHGGGVGGERPEGESPSATNRDNPELIP
ncbi:hypothetical protein ROTAS13_02760 [Roseomonas sp. TAS13]|nr:hypothetical protein ADP8_05119 [Roseomonas mucosa]GAV35088.1 hypothetical protein ROTAS13_02760 [Roseomonas sp. TAS13]